MWKSHRLLDTADGGTAAVFNQSKGKRERVQL